MNVVLIKTGNSDIHTQRTPYIDKGRDWGGVYKPRNVKLSEAGREAWNRFSLSVLRRNQP